MTNFEAELKNLAYRLNFDENQLRKHPETEGFYGKRIKSEKDRIAEIVVSIYCDEKGENHGNR